MECENDKKLNRSSLLILQKPDLLNKYVTDHYYYNHLHYHVPLTRLKMKKRGRKMPYLMLIRKIIKCEVSHSRTNLFNIMKTNGPFFFYVAQIISDYSLSVLWLRFCSVALLEFSAG